MATSTLSYFDAATPLKASQAPSSEIELTGLIERLMTMALQTSRADRGLLVVPQQPDGCWIEAEARINGNGIELNREPLANSAVPVAILRYVIHTQKSVIIDDALIPNMSFQDSYLASGATGPCSACLLSDRANSAACCISRTRPLRMFLRRAAPRCLICWRHRRPFRSRTPVFMPIFRSARQRFGT